MPTSARSYARTALLSLTLLTLAACGGGGGSDSTPPPTIPPANKAPTIGLSNVEVQANTTISLSAQAQDSDGSIASYQWQQTSGEQVTLTGADTATLSFDSPNMSQDITLVFSLTVTDDDGVGTTKEITVTVIANQTPTITLADMELQTTGVVEISAQAQDSDGSIASYEWRQVSGPDLTLSATTEEMLSFTPPSLVEQSEVVISLTVIDDDGATASKEITLTLIPNTQAFTVSGKVFTSSITFKNAPVTATIGTESFSTTTNELGQYTLEIGSLSNQLLDNMVVVSATGTASNSVVKLVSYVDDLRTLIDVAELNENEVSNSDISRLNITSISSAAAALIERENNEVAPATKADYLALERIFGSDHLMLTALLIDNVIDAVSTQNTVPDTVNSDDFNNVYDFIVNKDNARTLYYDISPTQNDIDMFADDINSSSDFVSTLAHFPEQQSQRVFYSLIGKLTLTEGGEGELFSSLAGKQSITWQQAESGLSISLSESKLQSSQTRDTAEYGYTYVDQYLDGYNVNISFDGINRDELLVTPQYSYQATEYEDAIVTAYVDVDAIQYSNYEHASILDLSENISSTSKYIVDFSHPNASKFINYQNESTSSDFRSLHLTFSSSSEVTLTLDLVNETTGEISTESIDATWSINSGELEITNDNWLITVAGLSTFNDAQTQTLVTAQLTQDEQVYYSSFQGSMYKKLDTAHQWSADNVAGVYQYFSLEEEINPLATHWYELRADGTLSYFFIFESNGEPIQEITESNISESPGLWRIVNDKLVIRRYRYNRTFVENFQRCHSEVWETTDDSECILYFQREWQLHSKFEEKNNSRELIQQRSQLFMDYQRAVLGPQTTPDGVLLHSVTSLNSHFIKRETRPVSLPSDYVLIKDGASMTNTIEPARKQKLSDHPIID